MQQFKNILFMDEPSEPRETHLEQAVATAEQGQGRLSVVHVLEPIPDRPGLGPEAAAAAQRLHLDRIEARVAPYRDRVPISTEVLWGTPFLVAIRRVLADGHDLLMKPALSGVGRRGLFCSADMHLLRKCPCPVWLLRPGSGPSLQRVVAAVDLDPYGPQPRARSLNLQILELALWTAVAESASLHVVHAWESIAEEMLRAWGNGDIAPREVEDEHRRHAEALHQLLEEVRSRVGTDAFDYVTPTPHVRRGLAWERVPEVARELGADLIVMGTTGRTGVPGLLIGNTAEDILAQVGCSVLVVKPPGFVSPVTAEQGPIHSR